MEKFVKRLKDLKEENKLSNKDIAKILKLSNVNAVYPWLNGKQYPIVKYMVKLAENFNCSIEFLLGRTEEVGGGKYNKIKPFDIQLKRIMNEKNKTQYRMEKDNICSANNFSMWFTKKCVPRFETIIKLEDYFGVTIDYMLGRE